MLQTSPLRSESSHFRRQERRSSSAAVSSSCKRVAGSGNGGLKAALTFIDIIRNTPLS